MNEIDIVVMGKGEVIVSSQRLLLLEVINFNSTLVGQIYERKTIPAMNLLFFMPVLNDSFL